MKLRILTLPLTLTIGMAATAFAADQPVTQPVANQTNVASGATTATSPATGKAAKDKVAKKARKHGKAKKVDMLSQQPAAK